MQMCVIVLFLTYFVYFFAILEVFCFVESIKIKIARNGKRTISRDVLVSTKDYIIRYPAPT